MTRQLESALAHARAGYRVFPAHGITDDGKCTCGRPDCEKSAGKHPAVSGWQQAATTDESQIRRWWRQNPLYNPAIATGYGQVVLDVDGDTGKASLRALEQEYGLLPPTRIVRTGGGGMHYYFSARQKIRNSAGKLGDHLDIRGEGGYVIAPGARHSSGSCYEWAEHAGPEDLPAASLPGWIPKRLKAESAAAAEPAYTDGVIPEGRRNSTLYAYGCSLRGQHGKTMREVEEALILMNQQKCVPPLRMEEIRTIVRQIDQFPRNGGAEQEFAPVRHLICAADVPDEETRFVLKPYLPEGQLTMIQGNPGDGKTAFACKLAALVSRGDPLLGLPCDSGNVLMLSVEDDRPVLRKRIAASGGDVNHCFFVSDASDLTFRSPEIEEYIREKKIRLVVFDPIQAFMGADVDMNRANETRPVLAALKEMAKRNRCAVVIISHINKGMKDGLAIQRSLGSMDIPGACRSILHVGRLEDDNSRRLAAHVKSSNAEEGKSIEFSIVKDGGVSLTQFTDKGYEDLSALGRKARNAAQNPFLLSEVLTACKQVLKEHPNGAKVAYRDLGILWPAGIRPGQLLESYRGRLEDEGIGIQTGQRVKGGASAVMITPFRFLEDDTYTAPSSSSSPAQKHSLAEGEEIEKGDYKNCQKGIQYGKNFLHLHANVS